MATLDMNGFDLQATPDPLFCRALNGRVPSTELVEGELHPATQVRFRCVDVLRTLPPTQHCCSVWSHHGCGGNWHPQLLAAEAGHSNVVEILLTAGAEPTARDNLAVGGNHAGGRYRSHIRCALSMPP